MFCWYAFFRNPDAPAPEGAPPPPGQSDSDEDMSSTSSFSDEDWIAIVPWMKTEFKRCSFQYAISVNLIFTVTSGLKQVFRLYNEISFNGQFWGLLEFVENRELRHTHVGYMTILFMNNNSKVKLW